MSGGEFMIKKLNPEKDGSDIYEVINTLVDQTNKNTDHSNRQDEALLYLSKIIDIDSEQKFKDYPALVGAETIVKVILSTDSNEEMK